MSLKKDKQRVLGEVFSDEQVKTFLDVTPPAGIDADFHCLEKAYRGMKADNFSTFLTFFKNNGHDINSQNQEGATFLKTILSHKQAEDYIQALQQHGAQ